MISRLTVVFIGPVLALFGMALSSWAAPPAPSNKVEERRKSRLIRHLKRLNRPGDWRIIRKLYSPDKNVQKGAFYYCPPPNTESPWYLSTGHLEDFRFTVDVIPVNMDSDPEDETLLVVQSDPGRVQYVTFCLVDDDRHGRTPFSSFSEISHQRPVTFQLADLTADGSIEIIVYVRDERSGRITDSVRIFKAKQGRQFLVVWFGQLRGQLPLRASKDDRLGRRANRNEKLQARMRISFNGDRSPATIIVRGERKLKKINVSPGVRRNGRRGKQKRTFEKYWRWDKKRFRFMPTTRKK
jgi:hypothetical protein